MYAVKISVSTIFGLLESYYQADTSKQEHFKVEAMETSGFPGVPVKTFETVEEAIAWATPFGDAVREWSTPHTRTAWSGEPEPQFEQYYPFLTKLNDLVLERLNLITAFLEAGKHDEHYGGYRGSQVGFGPLDFASRMSKAVHVGQGDRRVIQPRMNVFNANSLKVVLEVIPYTEPLALVVYNR